MPRRLIKPFEDFFRHEAAGGILLMLFAFIALIWANSPQAAQYSVVLDYHITLGFGRLALTNSLLHWVNDGLMAVFFFMVGMEIKRELLTGELHSLKKAALPIGAAIGGMVLPAAIYTFFNYGTPHISGWGIPMATDIAFALGVLSLIGGKKNASGLAVFLAALAIVDDLGAVLVIAVFYTEQISWLFLLIAMVILVSLVLVNKLRLESVSLFVVLGILLWLALLKSGVHATVAGVLLGMTIPVRSKKGSGKIPMLERLEHALQPWVAFGIMPVFALANAGVAIDFRQFSEVITNPVGIGIILGLFLGKQIGIFGAAYLLLRLKVATLPSRVTIRQLYGVSVLGGIGFTMSMFVTNLAFKDPNVLATAKISIITASLLSAVTGVAVLGLKSQKKDGRAIENGYN